MTTYTAVLLDADGFETARDSELTTLKAAKLRATYLLSDAFATSIETTHQILSTAKVEVRDQNDECVWDKFATTSDNA